MVIMADNKTKMLVDEYMFLPLTYDLNGESYLDDLRLTILKLAKGNDIIIIGFPEIAHWASVPTPLPRHGRKAHRDVPQHATVQLAPQAPTWPDQ